MQIFRTCHIFYPSNIRTWNTLKILSCEIQTHQKLYVIIIPPEQILIFVGKCAYKPTTINSPSKFIKPTITLLLQLVQFDFIISYKLYNVYMLYMLYLLFIIKSNL